MSRISRLELRARRVVEGFVSGMHKSPYRGLSVEFAGHRPYAVGDDLRRIDWRVYGKADRFFIKEYEEETNLRAHILLDCSGSMAYPEHPTAGRLTKWDYAATLAVSLAHLLLHQQDAVGLTLFDDRVRQQFPVSGNRGSLGAVVEALESTSPQGETGLKVPFEHLAGHIRHRGMVIVLSDLLADADEFAGGLARFRHDGHEVLVLHVLDQDELEFPFAERTRFEGLEDSARQVLTDPQSLRASYLAALRRFTSKIQAACLDLRVEYTLISTGDPLDVALTTFLASRMRRRHGK